MIVVAILGILAAIAVAKFGELIRKSSEATGKGNLGAIRGALSIYYGDMEGVYPANPAALTVGGKYLATVPQAKTPNYHLDSSQVTVGSFATGITDAGAWIYDGAAIDANYGSVYVNCSHTDTKGSLWEGY